MGKNMPQTLLEQENLGQRLGAHRYATRGNKRMGLRN